MIRKCNDEDREWMYIIINDAAEAYKGVIPPDRWHQPYMSREELAGEMPMFEPSSETKESAASFLPSCGP